MKGLDHEFSRFTEQCLGELAPADLVGAKLIFMSGACAATNRFLSILDADMPTARKQALLRRCAREMWAFQREMSKAEPNG